LKSSGASLKVSRGKNVNSKWIRGGCIAAAFFMAVLLFTAADKAGEIPLLPYLPDKLVHFCYYGVMAILLAHGLGRRWMWIPLAAVPIVGVLDEWHQFYTPGRDASVYDWAADASRTIVAVYGYRWWIRRSEGRGTVGS
jgi:VanZ family protein